MTRKVGILMGIMALGAVLYAPVTFSQDITVPLYKTGNVLALGLYNDSNTSSDLVGSAEISDNNGVLYVSGALGPAVAGTKFNWKVVFFADGTGAEIPNWRQRDFDDSQWNHDNELGFPIGHGTSSEEGKIDILLDPTNETVYTRSIFDAQNYDSITELTIKLAGDDSVVGWFNGVFLGITGVGTSDRGEEPENFTFDSTISSGSYGAWDEGDPFNFTGTGTLQVKVKVDLVDALSAVEMWELLP